jgi:hypothetical protein
VVDNMSLWRWAEYFQVILLMRFQRWRLVLGFPVWAMDRV